MSVTISTSTVIIVFIIIIIIASFTSILCDPECHDKSRWYVFVVTLAAFSIVLTFFFYYSLVEIQDEQHQLGVVEQTTKLSISITEITSKSMIKKKNSIPEFIKSLNPVDYGKGKTTDGTTYDKSFDRHALSHEIFSIWQSAVYYKDFTMIKEEKSYTMLFLQWANSEELYEEWSKHKITYSKDTIVYGDLLFKYGRNMKNYSSDSYVRACDKLMSCDTYKNIFV